ncbi:dicer-like protein [Calycina marina]|uniref:Dicer-like protein n=1 Tax=Calycina marina TaxID=1763456 RepID=A0A9P7Z646_9HELO|nr:dicer-like protein [Calycina marina]
MNQVLLSVKLHPQNAATTLATRTTENVIADLKRPIHPAHAIANTHWPAADTLNDEEPERITQWVKQTDPLSEFQDEGNYQIESQEDYLEPEEEDKAHVAKPRKISERKRRNAAIADRYIQSMLRRDLEDGISRVKPGEESQQSARWLVNQSESHRIISSPRAYQTELFDLAKEKNVIAVLDTGSGKTLIAVLLLRHVFAQELEDRARGKAKKVSFFLVDSVTLVFQQHAVLKANLDQPMNMFCGDMGTDLWNPEIWAKHLNENMVIVCTAEVLRHCLAHAFITIEQINLLIFDEAHHAKKDHPYSRIIMDHYARQPKHLVLPKIFGMTASPVDSKTDVKKAATDLETILHSQIVTAADGSLGGYKVTSKQEMVAAYQSLGPVFKTPLYEQMYSRFKDNKSIFRKPLKFASLATRELGSWCADQVWPFCLSEDESKKLLAKTEKHYHSKNIPEPLSVLEQRKAQLVEAKQILASHRFEVPDYTEGSLNSSNLSSKVVLLVQYLRERFERPTDDKAIIFVKQRYTARLLAQLFKLENIRTEHIQVGTLVGTRTGVAGDLNVSFRDQVITMMNFRSGKLNCLFATSVAEEGLDIPDCNLIIRFDLYDNLIQYIQSRGRARQANSRFIHMYENGNSDHMSMIKQVRINEDILERFCRALPEDRKLVGNEGNIDHFLAKERSHQVSNLFN